MNRCNAWWRAAGPLSRMSGGLLAFTICGWLGTSIWVWATHGFDPFEQVMLTISWGALSYTAVVALITSKAAEGCTCCPVHGPPDGGCE